MFSGDASAGRLVVRLFGPPRIELDGEPVALGRRKAIALLAYLAVTAERHRRDSLVNLLWPEVDATRGRAALRRTLFALNKALPGDWLDVDRSEIGLAPAADVWVDVRVFEDRLAVCESHGHPPSEVCPDCVAPLAEAAALARGDLMAGFSLKDSSNFDDWQVFQGEAHRRKLGEALDRLTRWHASERQFELALGYGRRRLALDPLDEAAHRQLMRVYAWSGQRSAALRQYDECVAALEEQLGVPPQEATAELCRAIKAGQAPALSPRAARVSIAARPTPNDELRPAARIPGTDRRRPIEPPAFLEEDRPRERPLFVARERELARLHGFLDLALAGQGRVAFVTGEAGSGKTSLVEAFARRALKDHPELLAATGNCNAYTGIGDPYLPFREILELLTGDVKTRWAAGAMSGDHASRLWAALPIAAEALVEFGPDLIDTFLPRAPLLERASTCARLADGTEGAAWLEELAERKPPATQMQSAQQSHLFEQYTRVLQLLSERGPLLLVTDDLQWADVGSVSLLFHLGRHLAGSRILIVGAYRPEEVVSGRFAGEGRERHPLASVVNELQRDFGEIAVDVDRAERGEFVDAVLDSEPNRLGRPFREMLYRQTQGHPLFTIELLRGMQERGDLVRGNDGSWTEGPALDWDTLPARIEAAIAERVGRLARASRDALRVASVEGEEFTAEIVARVLDVDDRDLVRLLSAELDRRHRLVRAQSIERLGVRRVSRYRFRNFLFQKYLYDNLDEVERAYLHEDVGNALEALYQDREGALDSILPGLARHFEEAGITEKAIRYLLEAGERSVRLSAYKEGTAQITRALSLLETLPDSPARAQQELAIQLALGMAHMGSDRAIARVEKAYTRALELCHRTGDRSQLWRILGQLAIVHYVSAQHHRARELAEEALALAQETGDPLLAALSHWRLGFIRFAQGEYAAARAHCEPMIAIYDPQHHDPLVTLSGSVAGPGARAYDACSLWCLGYPDQAAEQRRRALALARELAHPFSLADVLCFGGCLLSSMARDAAALQGYAEELLLLSAESGMTTWVQAANWYRGEALALQGRIQEGIAQMLKGIAPDKPDPERMFVTGILGSLGSARAAEGDLERGLEILAEALDQVEESGERLWEAELHRLRGDLFVRQADEASAEASFQRAIEVARGQQARSWELRATTSLARLWRAQGREGEARRVLSEVYEWFTEGFDTGDLLEAKALLEELA